MLRMGRSPKPELEEGRPQTDAGQPRQFQPQPNAAPTPAARPTQATPPVHEPPAQPAAPRAVTESEALARDLKEGVVSGFVGTGTTVAGDAEFKGMLRVDGHFRGRIRSEKGALIVSAGGVVDADVEVATARVNGTVNGDITASERIEFGRSARVRGNIRTPALVIEQGAIFEGQCRMQPEASEAVPARPAAARPTAPQPAPAKPAAAARPPQTSPARPPQPAPAPAASGASDAG